MLLITFQTRKKYFINYITDSGQEIINISRNHKWNKHSLKLSMTMKYFTRGEKFKTIPHYTKHRRIPTLKNHLPSVENFLDIYYWVHIP